MVLINFPVPPAAMISYFDDQLWFRVAISHQFFGTVLLLLLSAWFALQARASDPEIGAASTTASLRS